MYTCIYMYVCCYIVYQKIAEIDVDQMHSMLVPSSVIPQSKVVLLVLKFVLLNKFLAIFIELLCVFVIILVNNILFYPKFFNAKLYLYEF